MKKGHDIHGEYLDSRFGSEAIRTAAEAHQFPQGEMRIMCRRGFEMDFAQLLMDDFRAALAYLKAHLAVAHVAHQNSFKHS